MKTSFPAQISAGGSRQLAMLVTCAALLLTFRPANANTSFVQYGPANWNVWNFYDYNGNTMMSDGTDPVAPFSGSPKPTFTIYNSYTPTAFSGTIPLSMAETANSAAITIPGLSGPVPGAYATFFLGNTPNGAEPTLRDPTSYGVYVTLYLNNPNSAPDEVRLDWTAAYQYTGSSSITLGTSPMSAIISGYASSIGSFYALAGGEIITNVAQGYAISNSIGAGTAPGDGFTQSVWGLGPWNGAVLNSTSYYINIPTAPFQHTLNLNSGDWISVQGYLDLVVDPGVWQVQMGILPPPQLGISSYSNNPVIFYPTIPGTNFVLQTITNLNTGNWVPVTNGIPISGLIITNATSPAFYQLN